MSCDATKHLNKDEYLLDKVKLEVDNPDINTDALSAIIKQNPNRKILGLFRFHLAAYNYADKAEEQTRFKEWIKESVGEPPVILDEFLTEKSRKQLKYYLTNNGYFNAIVTDTTIFNDESMRSEVHYKVKALTPYKVGKIIYEINGNKAIIGSVKNSGLMSGKNYSVDLFNSVRNNITNYMKNHGFYTFSKEYLQFKVDSNLKTHRININLVVKNPIKKIRINGKDTLLEGLHEVYFLKNIYIDPLYSPNNRSTYLDTTVINNIQFLHSTTPPIRPEVLSKMIFLKPDDIYRQDNVEYTYNRLASLNQFKFINIRYEKAETIAGRNYLDCFIHLTPMKKQSFTIEAEGTHRQGNLGVAGSFVYQNKNVLQGAELLQIKVYASKEQNYDNGYISEYGPEISLGFPKLLLPFQSNKLPKYSSPASSIVARYNFQSRNEFKRNIANVSFQYDWKTSQFNSHSLSPIDISLVEINKSDAFKEALNSINNTFLTNSYSNHLILATIYGYKFNNQKINSHLNFVYFDVKLESAGNLLRILSPGLGLKQDPETGVYNIFNIQYAQYIKPEFDLRIYNILNKRSEMVYRLFAGIGIPLANTRVLPFEKSYFGGGSNGIRAWQARTLGPGGLNDSTSFLIDQIGDIQLEANVEYRFVLYKSLEGALFVDAGNIWLWNEDNITRPGGQLELDKFYKQFAVGGGVGIRIDMSFLTIRLDYAYPMRDPSLIDGEQWFFQSKDLTNQKREELYGIKFRHYAKPIFNLGLGYPF